MLKGFNLSEAFLNTLQPAGQVGPDFLEGV
jgi:hypothetical protein